MVQSQQGENSQQKLWRAGQRRGEERRKGRGRVEGDRKKVCLLGKTVTREEKQKVEKDILN
jgi:hypothetical protein